MFGFFKSTGVASYARLICSGDSGESNCADDADGADGADGAAAADNKIATASSTFPPVLSNACAMAFSVTSFNLRFLILLN